MTSDRLQILLDKDEIRDLIAKYAQGTDNPDPKLFMSVFSDDIEMEFANLGIIAKGMAQWRKLLMSGELRRMTFCDIETSTHIMANELIEVDGDQGTGIIHCVSHLIGARDGKPYSAQRGLTYHDRYRRVEGAWKICYRRHTLKWLVEGTPSPLPF